MPLKIYKRKTGIYHLRGTFQGQRVDRSLKTRDKVIADRLRQDEEHQIVTEQIHGPRATTTFEKAALAYMKAGGSPRFLEPLIEYFAGRTVSRITHAELVEFASDTYPDRASATINRQVFAPASAVLNYAAGQGWRSPIRVKKLREPRGKTRWLTVEEAERLIENAGPLKLFITMALESAARSGELLSLDWENVDINDHKFLLLPNGTKTGKQRLAYFGKRTSDLLSQSSGRVILNSNGAPYKLREKPGSIIKGSFDRAVARAGLTDVTPHTLRHTWATWAMAMEPNIIRVKEHGGWSSTSQLERYAKVAPNGYGKKVADAGWMLFGR